MLVRRTASGDASVQAADSAVAKALGLARPVIEGQIQRLQHSSNDVLHSVNLTPSLWSSVVGRKGADVVNLHWIGAGTLSIRDVGRIRRPVVLSLHDMWGFCGAEHYAPDEPDARWQVGYRRNNRPSAHKGLDLDRFTWRRKRKHWGPMAVICGSRWLADCARRSSLMEGWPIHVIPQALDLEVYRPVGREVARRILGFAQDEIVVLFSGGEDSRKGHDLVGAVLARLADTIGQLSAVDFGRSEPIEAPRLGVLRWRWMGHLHDDITLALLYCAADVALVPSRQDNLPQVATEAQACGLPVVGFKVGGMDDAVDHLATGYLADPFSVDDLVRGLLWVLENDGRRASLGRAARRRAADLWNAMKVVRSHVAVFEEAIEAHARRGGG